MHAGLGAEGVFFEKKKSYHVYMQLRVCVEDGWIRIELDVLSISCSNLSGSVASRGDLHIVRVELETKMR